MNPGNQKAIIEKRDELAPFATRLKKSLADENIAAGILDFQRRWRENRDESIGILERETGKTFREMAESLAEAKKKARNSSKILEKFIGNAQKAGSQIIQSADAPTACSDITGILKSRGVNLVVKSKSMLTEEIFLNSHLERNGITPIETDLGQWILQIGDEHPSHLVIPAIHKRRHQIAELYEKVLGKPFDPEDIETMAKVVRPELRRHFLEAGAGITGGNVLIAETGSVGIVTNEGNANLTSGLSKIHIAVVGIDKLIDELAEAFELLRLLSKSGTGQIFTTYFSLLTGPRRGIGGKDGKEGKEGKGGTGMGKNENEQFIVLVDNGRTALSLDEEFSSAMGCIRCGACANVCPPYQAVGGHAFGHIYTGAIGLINTSFHHSEKFASGPASLCVSCRACETVCPADIPLAEQILSTRHRLGKRKDSLLADRSVRLGLFVWAHPRLFRSAVQTGKRLKFLSRLLPEKYSLASVVISNSEPPARKQLAGNLKVESTYKTEVTGKKVALFMQCIADQIAPEIATATARLIAAAGAEVVLPPNQHCCGLPALDAGNHKLARKMAEDTFKSLTGDKRGQGRGVEMDEVEMIVTPGTSCAITMTQEYEKLTGRKLEVLDIVEFLAGPGKLPDGCLNGTENGIKNNIKQEKINSPLVLPKNFT